MAITRQTAIPLPFAGKRYTPDSSALAALYVRMGANLADLDLRKGEIKQQGAERLASIFGNYTAARREDAATKAAIVREATRHKADQDFQAQQAELTRKAAEQDRIAARQERQDAVDRAAAATAVEDIAPGPVEDTPQNRVVMQLASRFPETAARFQGNTTLPAVPVDPVAGGTVAPPSRFTERVATGKEAAAAGAVQRSVEAQAAAMKERATDNVARDAAAAEAKRHNIFIENKAAEAAAQAAGDKVTLTPAGLNMAALNYRKTGVMPPLGMGDKGTRQNIINRAASLTPVEMAQIEATGGDIAAAKQDYTANTESLKALQKSRDAIGAFEKTATKNIDVFLDTAGKVVDSGSPLANTLLRSASGKLLGSPDQAAYDAARQVATNEIAKITSNPTLSGQLSDSARHEVDAFNPANATLAQSVRVMRLLKTEMNNRITALDDELSTVRGRAKTTVPVTGAPKEGDTKPIDGYPGTEQKFINGQWVRTK